MDTPLCPAYIQLIEYILKNKEKQIQDLILWNSWNLEKNNYYYKSYYSAF